MKKMIYQIGTLAGWPHALAKELRAQGFESINIIHNTTDKSGTTNSIGKSNRRLRHDECLNEASYGQLRQMWNRVRLVLRILRNGSIVHYHGTTILPYSLDVLIFKWFNVPTLISWGGGDARLVDVSVAKNPYFFRYQETQRDKEIRTNLKRLANYGIQVATDPEMGFSMQGFFDTVYTFRQPIDANELHCQYPKPENKKPVFLHIPTHPFVKGTVHIIHAFERLKKEGFEFETVLLESVLTQDEMRKKISECDVYVDELRCGAYGYTALEAAGSGKPTMTYIIDEVVQKLPADLPFVNTNADNLYDNLKMLITHPQQRYDIGVKSRKYVEKHHHVAVVAKDMIDLYKRLGAKGI